MQTRVLRTLTALLVATPLAAVAASDEKPAYKEADANGDGQVTVSEAVKVGVPKAEARSADIDDDGKLTQDDWKFVDMDAPSTGESG